MTTIFRKNVLQCAIALLPACFACTALAAPPDLTTTDGFECSCAALPLTAKDLKTNQERQAFVVCRDIALAKNVITFATNAQKTYLKEGASEELFSAVLRGQLSLMRDELRTVRQVLEQTKLKKDEGLVLAPAQWKTDLDGDGEIKTWESYFFAIPKRGRLGFQFRMPSDDLDYYANEYRMDAKIRVDQSDILWTLAYHYFAESLLEIVLSYHIVDTKMNRESIQLQHPDGMKRAAQLMIKGFKTSEAMRLAVLAETDDKDEWISNPKQKNSVFPMPLDAQDFQIWGTMLSHVIPLFEGKTLLVANKKSSGLLGAAAKFCPENQGLSIPLFFSHPPQYPMDLMEKLDLSSMCKPIDKKHPASGLFTFIETYANNAESKDNAAMNYLRNLLWVN